MKNSLLLSGVGLCLLPAVFSLQAPVVVPAARPIPLTAAPDGLASKGLEGVVGLANTFRATLPADQVATLQRAYSKADAVRWSNFPEFAARPRRVGIRLGSLNATQLKAAKALMAAAMAQNVTNEGYDELEGNLAADAYLGNLTGKTELFNSGNYYVAFLGAPSTTGLWELQFGGHHFAFANTYNGGKATGVTPSFRGVEPIAPVTVGGRTYQPMEQEREAFAQLLGSLSSSEQATAKLSSTFRDILLGPDRDGQFPATRQGLRAGDLTAAKKALVLHAIERYVHDLDPETAAAVLANYTAGLADTYVAYSGSGTMSEAGDYVRIDGPRVWIEYSGQASRDIPGTVHPHSVWRDRTSDYGGN